MKTVYNPLPAPAAPSLSYTAGGSLGATTYYVKIVYRNSFLQLSGQFGTTLASAESLLAVPANNLLVVTSPVASGNATGWSVYVSITSGSETLQSGTATPIAIGTNWTEPTSGLISGGGLPTTNTTFQDNTAVVLAYLLANRTLYTGLLYSFAPSPTFRTLPTSPVGLISTYYFTDLPYPVHPTLVPLPSVVGLNSVVSNVQGGTKRAFHPIRITRSAFEYDIGLKANSTDFEWDTKDTQITPPAPDKAGSTAIPPYIDAFLTNAAPTDTTASTIVYENFKTAFTNGQLDNGYVLVWRVFMPTQGDCDTLGMCVVWGGRISQVTVDRAAVKFTVISALELLQTQVPSQLIEPGNRSAQYGQISYFPAPGAGNNVIAGSTTMVLISGGTLQAPGSLADGELVYTYGASGGQVARNIQNNTNVGGNNVYYLYEPLPITPTPGTDQIQHLYLPIVIDNSAGVAHGFPYVPVPETAI